MLTVNERGVAVFDMDGPLTDTARLQAEAWRRALAPFGINYGEAEDGLTRGVPREAAARGVLASRAAGFGTLPEAERRQLVEDVCRGKQAQFEQLLDEAERPGAGFRLAAQRGVEGLLAYLKATGWRLAVASASKNCDRIVRAVGLEWAFETIAGPHSAPGTLTDKSAVFRAAVAVLGADPRTVIVVEDASNGVRAAHQAELACIGVAVSETAEMLAAAGADDVVPHTSCLTPARLDRAIVTYWSGRAAS